MYAQVEKPKENKSRAVANSSGQKKNAVVQGFGFVDNRPYTKTQESVSNQKLMAIQLKQLSPIGKNSVVQGKFAGTYGGIMDVLTPERLGAKSTLYEVNWNKIKDCGTDILVEDGGGLSCFAPDSSTLNLNGTQINALFQHIQEKKKLPQDELADFVALITHELSHANDSVNKGRELKSEKGTVGDDAVINVIETELRAWANEAETRERLMPEDKKDSLLWSGWMALDKPMIESGDNVKAKKDTNEVVARYWRYVTRELKPESMETLKSWFDSNSETIWSHMERLQEQLKKRNP